MSQSFLLLGEGLTIVAIGLAFLWYQFAYTAQCGAGSSKSTRTAKFWYPIIVVLTTLVTGFALAAFLRAYTP